jgi:hypothetical protein
LIATRYISKALFATSANPTHPALLRPEPARFPT